MTSEQRERLRKHFLTHTTTNAGNFFEGHSIDPSCVIFNKEYEHTDTTYSFRKLYMEFLDDPTEVAFVDGVLGGRFDVLEAIKTNTRLKSFYKSVRLEAEQRRIAANVKEITDIAYNGSEKSRMGALKYLCDNSFVEAESEIKRGRPSKAEKEGAMKIALKEMTEVDEDLARLLQ